MMNIQLSSLLDNSNFISNNKIVNTHEYILDPFSGSGITGIVSSSLKRKCVLFEIDEQYYKASINRFTDMGITYESIQ